MRIANLLMDGLDGYDPSPALVRDDVEVEVVRFAFPPLPSNATDTLLTSVAAVEAALRAEEQGFDALFINSVADYGLAAVRSAVRIPAVGAGEAAMLTACGLGERFSIVTVLPPWVGPCLKAQMRESFMADRCASIRYVTSPDEYAEGVTAPDGWYVGMRSRRRDIVERIGAQVRAAVEEDGADAIVLGCCCMSPAAKELATYTSAPVIDPLDAALLHAEMRVRLGVTQSPTCHVPMAASRRDVVEAMTRVARAPLTATPVVAEEPCGDVCSVLGEPARTASAEPLAAGV